MSGKIGPRSNSPHTSSVIGDCDGLGVLELHKGLLQRLIRTLLDTIVRLTYPHSVYGPETMPNLLSLAAKFAPLSEAEKRLLDAATKNDVAICGPNDNDKDPRNNPANIRKAEAERQIRANLIRWLCVNRQASALVDPSGVQVYGAHILGMLDLSNVPIPFRLMFLHCRFWNDLDLSSAGISEFDLRGTWVTTLAAERLEVGHSVWLCDGFHSFGEVRLLGARIGGDLQCGNGELHNPFQHGVRDTGMALNASRIIVKGVVLLSPSFRADGEVQLIDADIGGMLACGSSTFNNPQSDGGSGVALNADRAVVKAGIFLNNGFSARGEVRLIGAKVGVDLNCTAGSFVNNYSSGADALSADAIEVNSSVLLGKDSRGRNFQAKGNVRFLDARIEGMLDCVGGQFECLELQRAVIKHGFRWFQIHGPKSLQLYLTNTSVSALSDDQASWPSRGNLFLDGFTYDRIASGPADARARIEWLSRQLDFKPQPYRQLAKILKDLGDDDGQRYVLVEMERRERAGELSSPFLRFTIGYGYHPLWALWWLGGLSVLGWIIFRRARLSFAPTDEKVYKAFKINPATSLRHYVPFSPAVYSFENSLPLVKLGQADRWQPDPSPSDSALATDEWVAHLAKLVDDRTQKSHSKSITKCATRCLAIIEYVSRVTKSPVFLRRFLWLQILLGWILATLFAAGLAGIVHQ